MYTVKNTYTYQHTYNMPQYGHYSKFNTYKIYQNLFLYAISNVIVNSLILSLEARNIALYLSS